MWAWINLKRKKKFDQIEMHKAMYLDDDVNPFDNVNMDTLKTSFH